MEWVLLNPIKILLIFLFTLKLSGMGLLNPIKILLIYLFKLKLNGMGLKWIKLCWIVLNKSKKSPTIVLVSNGLNCVVRIGNVY